MRLTKEFYRKSSYEVAINLLGKIICIVRDGVMRRYRIVETEAYGGVSDKAAHSYQGRRTTRTNALYLDGGHVYVYFIYGMYYMLNIVANQVDIPEGVLIRAVEPLNDDHKKIANGPGKLCKAMGIDKTYNELDLCKNNEMYLEEDDYVISEIIYTKRVNIDYAEEDRDRFWRFYIKNHPSVSKK